MLLKQLLESPITSSKLVAFDPFQAVDREALVREVIGLANARVEGPRNILFGVNPGSVDGDTLVGIAEESITDLKRAHRLVSRLVEPAVDLAFIFDRINGKLVGALEIDGCDYGPYFLAQDLGETMQRGSCWLREDRELLEVERSALVNGQVASVDDSVIVLSPEDVHLSIGFGEDPDCEFTEVSVPDSSDPPFAADGGTKKSKNIAQAIKDTVNTVTTRILKVANPSEDAGAQVAEAANQHYFFEERAVKLDFCVRNEGDVDVNDLSIEFGLPKLKGLDVADRLYTSPFDKRSEEEIRKMGYPEVELRDDATFIRGTIGLLPAQKTQPLFGTSLRLSVGSKAQGRKVAMQYVVRGPDGKRLSDGRLKVRLGERAKGRDVATETAHQNLAEA